jgi:hypothetical protein
MKEITPKEYASTLVKTFGTIELALECIRELIKATSAAYWYRVKHELEILK